MANRIPLAFPGGRLQTLLAALSLWACAETLLVWTRTPQPHNALPMQVQWQGRWLKRMPAQAPQSALPDQVVVIGGADYQSPGSPLVALRWIKTSSSGSGVTFKLEQIAPALLGKGATGVCRVYDDEGRALLGIAKTNIQLKALMGQTNPNGSKLGLWVAGLGPWRLNRCLLVAVKPDKQQSQERK